MEKETADDLEEGEIIDYDPLPRPNIQARPDGMKYSDNSDDDNVSNNSDSDIDSDSPCFSSKRAKISNKVKHINREQTSRKKKYSVWCNDIQESELANELVNCDVRPKNLDRSRDVESYDYTLAYSNGGEGDECDNEPDVSNRKRRFHESHNGALPRISVHQRLGPRRNDANEPRSHPRLLMDLKVTEDDNVEDIAADIASKLYEYNEDLIFKAVQFLGKEKAISLYRKCKDIEAAGGMLVHNRARRRTSGGVFITLIKSDNNITREIKKEIFRPKVSECPGVEGSSPSWRANDSVPVERDLPALLTKGELTVQQFAEAKKGNREEVDGEKPVTNPPPSPATDGGEQIDETREITYDDDFLDLGCDTMDIF